MAREDKCYCYFHRKQVVVGVCALCLHERLVILAASHNKRQSSSSTTTIHLPRIFAFASFLNRFEFRHSKSYNHDVSASPEDSFISIKFEENGKASWEKAKVSKVGLDDSWNHHHHHHHHHNNNNITHGTTKTVIEQGKPLRWRKRIGRVLFHLIKWKRSNGGNASQVDRKKSWMSSLTKRGEKKDMERRN